MSDPTAPSTDVDLLLEDGGTVSVDVRIAAQIRGIDADRDLLIHDGHAPAALDDSEHLIPLTPCCHATGKGSSYSDTGVVCRGRDCYRDVDLKYGCPGRLAVRVVSTVATTCTVPLDGETGHLLTATAVTGGDGATISLTGVDGDDRALRGLVRGALAYSGHQLRHGITVYLTPPQGSLPASAVVAVAALAANAGISPRRLTGTAVFGDVWGDGTLRPLHGVQPAVQAARARGIGRVIVPWSCRAEAGLVDDVEVLGAQSLTEIADWLHGNDDALRGSGSATVAAASSGTQRQVR